MSQHLGDLEACYSLKPDKSWAAFVRMRSAWIEPCWVVEFRTNVRNVDHVAWLPQNGRKSAVFACADSWPILLSLTEVICKFTFLIISLSQFRLESLEIQNTLIFHDFFPARFLFAFSGSFETILKIKNIWNNFFPWKTRKIRGGRHFVEYTRHNQNRAPRKNLCCRFLGLYKKK